MFMCWCLDSGSQCGEHVDDDVRKRSRYADDGGNHKSTPITAYTFEREETIITTRKTHSHPLRAVELSYRVNFQSFLICHDPASLPLIHHQLLE